MSLRLVSVGKTVSRLGCAPCFRQTLKRPFFFPRSLTRARTSAANSKRIVSVAMGDQDQKEVLHLEAELAVDCKNFLGESPLWCPERSNLFWVDIQEKVFHEFNPDTGKLKTWNLPERVGSIAMKEDGGFIFSFEQGMAEYDLDQGVIKTRFHDFEPENPTTRINDGRCDYQGRFLAGGFNEAQATDGGRAITSMYRLASDGSVSTLFDGIRISNGLAFSKDGSTMYWTDSPTRKVWKFDYSAEEDGAPSNKRLFYEMPETDPGIKDGSTVDSEDHLWNAEFLGSRVVRHRPSDGKIDTIVHLPVPNPTSVALGGPNLDTLYITTARMKMSEEDLADKPSAGGIYVVKVPVPGLPEPKFKASST